MTEPRGEVALPPVAIAPAPQCTPVTDAAIERYVAGVAPEPELDELLFGTPLPAWSSAAEQLAAYHTMRAPRTVAEACTAAHLLGLPPDAIEAIRHDWGQPSLDPGRGLPRSWLERNAARSREYAV